MFVAKCDVCVKEIETKFDRLEIPLNGTGKILSLAFDPSPPTDFHVCQKCVFDSIRAAERRLNEPTPMVVAR